MIVRAAAIATALVAVDVPAPDVKDDLRVLLDAIESRFAYAGLKDVDLEAELDAVARAADDGLDIVELTRRLDRVVSRLGDGHAGIRGPSRRDDDRYLPFLLADTDGGVVAFESDRSGLLDERHPFVVAIDGEPLDRWVAVSAERVVDGSPQLVRRRALRGIRDLTELRTTLGVPRAPRVFVDLLSADGASRVTAVRPIAMQRPIYGPWPRTPTRRLEGDIGYLRFPAMDDSEIHRMIDAMARFRDTVGLIVDVRGNTGGRRGLLRAFYPYLMDEGEGPAIVNIARHRLHPDFGPGHLAARFMRPVDDASWSPEARVAIDRVMAGFEPEWAPDPRRYSLWHVMVIERTLNERAYHYDRLVIVLADSGCFSATDIFLGALAARDDVVIIGRPSSGGSARVQEARLPNTGLRVRLASMASYRPDGHLYDGRGIEVDEDVLPAPGDLVGRGDVVLDRACAIIAELASGGDDDTVP